MLKWAIIVVLLAYSVIGYASPNSAEVDDFDKGFAAAQRQDYAEALREVALEQRVGHIAFVAGFLCADS